MFVDQALDHIVRDHREQPVRVPHEGVQQEPSQEHEAQQDRRHLRHEAEGLLLDGGRGLEDGDDEAHRHGDQQDAARR